MSKSEPKGNGQQQPSEIAIKYVQARDFRIVPANGCYGGVTPRGEIMINFFEEHYPTPDLVVHHVTDAGTLGPEKVRHGESGLVRELQVAIVLLPSQAESIGKWLLSKVEEFNKAIAQEKKEGSR